MAEPALQSVFCDLASPRKRGQSDDSFERNPPPQRSRIAEAEEYLHFVDFGAAGGHADAKGLSTGLHLSMLGSMYDPRCDSCVKALVRLLE